MHWQNSQEKLIPLAQFTLLSWKTDCTAQHYTLKKVKSQNAVAEVTKLSWCLCLKGLLRLCSRNTEISHAHLTVELINLKLSCPSVTTCRKHQCKWPIKKLQRKGKILTLNPCVLVLIMLHSYRNYESPCSQIWQMDDTWNSYRTQAVL